MYNEMYCADLEGMRMSKMIHQKENGGMITIDEECEILNDQLKKMTLSVKIDTLLHKYLFISLMKRRTKVLSPENINTSYKPENKGTPVIPTRRIELNAVNKLFESVIPFTTMGRKVTDN